MTATLREKVWRRLHLSVNRVAHRLAGPPYVSNTATDFLIIREGRRNMHWLWRLNDWIAARYVPALVARGRKS